MLRAFPDLDALLVPVGGGGLISGVAVAAKALSPAIEIFGVETALYPSLYQRLRGEPVTAGGNTLADGIAVKTVGDLPLSILRERVHDVVLVSEAEIERAVYLYLELERTVVEGAGAAGVAALLTQRERFAARRVGIVVSGGNIDLRILSSIIMRSLVRDGRIMHLRVEITDLPGSLAKVTGLVGQCGGNIIDVVHQRLFSDITVKSADLDMIVETRDSGQVEEILQALEESGFPACINPTRPAVSASTQRKH